MLFPKLRSTSSLAQRTGPTHLGTSLSVGNAAEAAHADLVRTSGLPTAGGASPKPSATLERAASFERRSDREAVLEFLRRQGVQLKDQEQVAYLDGATQHAEGVRAARSVSAAFHGEDRADVAAHISRQQSELTDGARLAFVDRLLAEGVMEVPPRELGFPNEDAWVSLLDWSGAKISQSARELQDMEWLLQGKRTLRNGAITPLFRQAAAYLASYGQVPGVAKTLQPAIDSALASLQRWEQLNAQRPPHLRQPSLGSEPRDLFAGAPFEPKPFEFTLGGSPGRDAFVARLPRPVRDEILQAARFGNETHLELLLREHVAPLDEASRVRVLEGLEESLAGVPLTDYARYTLDDVRRGGALSSALKDLAGVEKSLSPAWRQHRGDQWARSARGPESEEALAAARHYLSQSAPARPPPLSTVRTLNEARQAWRQTADAKVPLAPDRLMRPLLDSLELDAPSLSEASLSRLRSARSAVVDAVKDWERAVQGGEDVRLYPTFGDLRQLLDAPVNAKGLEFALPAGSKQLTAGIVESFRFAARTGNDALFTRLLDALPEGSASSLRTALDGVPLSGWQELLIEDAARSGAVLRVAQKLATLVDGATTSEPIAKTLDEALALSSEVRRSPVSRELLQNGIKEATGALEARGVSMPSITRARAEAEMSELLG